MTAPSDEARSFSKRKIALLARDAITVAIAILIGKHSGIKSTGFSQPFFYE
ncbi:hypothetical protein [Coleofasciculus sp. G2-EDA-02]|uniref:hypothetical protein n=1 Tax=unclassified Coleofasciculus TaxID=2692782 RepID=UPI0032F20720